MESTNSSGVRRGAWSKDEDILLKKCIQTFGEGRWHLVPRRAGLNRHGKSCRLRWVNYLNPDIKRDCFTNDEIDLLVRLHKLLGNRWSWIAGRIPGRTANDVKNFWNTHIMKASSTVKTKKTVQKIKIIKPKPHKLVVRNKITEEAPPQQQTLQCSDVGNDCSNQIDNHHMLSEFSMALWEMLGFDDI